MRWLTVCALVLAAAGCGESDDDTTPETEPDAAQSSPPPEGDIYQAGMEKAGANGLATVRLVDALPAPPDRGDNRWVIEVEADGQMMAGCAVTVVPDMPLHGHGTDEVEITEMGDGQYKIAAMNLFMPGLWVIPIDVVCGEMSDQVVYEFWIEG